MHVIIDCECKNGSYIMIIVKTTTVANYNEFYLLKMALKAATFTKFKTYELNSVQITDQELGYGSYATVLELKYMGLNVLARRSTNFF